MHIATAEASASLRLHEGVLQGHGEDIVDVEGVDLGHHDEEQIEVDVAQVHDENAVLIHKRLLRIDKGLGGKAGLRVTVLPF